MLRLPLFVAINCSRVFKIPGPNTQKFAYCAVKGKGLQMRDLHSWVDTLFLLFLLQAEVRGSPGADS